MCLLIITIIQWLWQNSLQSKERILQELFEKIEREIQKQ